MIIFQVLLIEKLRFSENTQTCENKENVTIV